MLSNGGNGAKKPDFSLDWFKVSRRLVESSTWSRCSPQALKVLLYLMERSQRPNNPEPGYILVGPSLMAMHCGFTLEATLEALGELCREDPESMHGGQPTVREVEGGYYLTAFDDYHPNARERAEIVKAKRAEAGRKGGLSTQAKNRQLREDDGGPV